MLPTRPPPHKWVSSNYRISIQSLFKILAYQWCLSSLSSSCSGLASPHICDAVFISRNQDPLPSEDWFTIWEWSLFCQGVNIVQDCVPEIVEIMFRPNSINIAFYYPRKNHKTLVTASCIPTLWKTFMTSVSIFMSVPQFSPRYLEQLVTMLLDRHPFCTAKILISSVSISKFLVWASWGFVCPLPLVCGQWPGQHISVLQSLRHASLGIYQQGPLGSPSISDHSCEQSLHFTVMFLEYPQQGQSHSDKKIHHLTCLK